MLQYIIHQRREKLRDSINTSTIGAVGSIGRDQLLAFLREI